MKPLAIDRDLTDYLKGFAITAVYINHFVNGYVSKSFLEYANGFISLFFILSGFGIYTSLSHLSNQDMNSGVVWRFFKKRFLRIYPLFWIWCIIDGFSNGFLGFFGLDILYPKSPWFIPAIIQCYLLAPLLFIIFRSMSTKKSLIMMTLSFIILNYFMFYLIGEPFRSIGYRGLFFNHIFLFLLGFILAKLENLKTTPVYLCVLCIIVYFFNIHETTPQAFIEFPLKQTIFSFVFPFSTFIFCYAIFSSKIYLPLKNTLKTIGKYTFSIYLFHGIGFSVLLKIGLIQKMDISAIDLLIVLIFTPFFILMYALAEIIVEEFLFGTKNPDIVISKSKGLLYAFIPFQITARPSS